MRNWEFMQVFGCFLELSKFSYSRVSYKSFSGGTHSSFHAHYLLFSFMFQNNVLTLFTYLWSNTIHETSWVADRIWRGKDKTAKKPFPLANEKGLYKLPAASPFGGLANM